VAEGLALPSLHLEGGWTTFSPRGGGVRPPPIKVFKMARVILKITLGVAKPPSYHPLVRGWSSYPRKTQVRGWSSHPETSYWGGWTTSRWVSGFSHPENFLKGWSDHLPWLGGSPPTSQTFFRGVQTPHLQVRGWSIHPQVVERGSHPLSRLYIYIYIFVKFQAEVELCTRDNTLLVIHGFLYTWQNFC
jgi:hypothetical protein